MQILFNAVLALNLFMEAIAAAGLIAGPGGVSAAGSGGQWSMHYGFAALAMASASLWLWPYRNRIRPVTAVLGVLATFHTGLFLSLALAGDQTSGMIAHAVLAALCVFLFAQRSKWCVQ